MNINKYIKWDEIWSEEIDIKNTVDYVDEDNVEFINVINQFNQDNDVELLMSECDMNGDKLIFFFSESGGQNESDTQGWSRDYTFIVDSNFMVLDAEYSQG